MDAIVTSRKLKVFQAQFGFYDTVVAAPNQAAALRAWGTRQNLFASGAAKLITDEGAVAAATAHPETPLKRAVGSNDPFALEPTSLPKVPDAPKKAAAKPARKEGVAPMDEPRADRSNLDAAERAFDELVKRRKAEQTDFGREEEDLRVRRASARSAYVEAHKMATAKLTRARTAFRIAGGGSAPSAKSAETS